MYLQTLSHSAIAASVSSSIVVGIEVEQADPFEAVDRVELAQQTGEGAALLAVDAVERRVLRDEQQFFDAARGERARFLHDRRGGPAAVVAAQRRE